MTAFLADLYMAGRISAADFDEVSGLREREREREREKRGARNSES